MSTPGRYGCPAMASAPGRSGGNQVRNSSASAGVSSIIDGTPFGGNRSVLGLDAFSRWLLVHAGPYLVVRQAELSTVEGRMVGHKHAVVDRRRRMRRLMAAPDLLAKC